MQDVSKFIALTGRVQSYVEQQDSGVSNALMPVSCSIKKYRNDIFDVIKYLSVALRGGAGICVNLDDFKARQPQVDKQYFFYLPEDHPDYAELTNEQKKRLVTYDYANNNTYIIKVNDSMEDETEELHSIQNSWEVFIEALVNLDVDITIDLSRLRPKGIDNGKGLTSSGAVSFLTIYEAILNHINKGDLISLMQLAGQMNDVLRRGGCVSGDTWIQTKDGARQVHELVGTKFTAIVNGEYVDSGDEGFWSTGFQDVYELTTTGGQKVKLTENHKILKKVSKNKPEWTELKDIQVGDYVLLNEHRVVPSWNGKGSFQLGWLIGQVIGNGSVQHRKEGRNDQASIEFFGEYGKLQKETAIRYLEMENLKHPTGNEFTGSKSVNDNNVEKWRVRSSELAKVMAEFGITPESKYVTSNVERYGSSEFYIGLLRGLFDADGTVRNAKKHKDSRCVILAQINIDTMYAVQRMLLRLGIQSSIYTNSKTYSSGVVAGYDVTQKTPGSQLVITRDNIEVFRDVVGFSKPDKIEKLNDLLDSYTQGITECLFEAEVKSIERHSHTEVFDCSIEDVHEFDGNGFRLHNCFKNGIVTFSLYYKHPDIIKYLNVPLADIPGSGKKGIIVDSDILQDKRLMKLVEVRVNDKSLMLEKTIYKVDCGYEEHGGVNYEIGVPLRVIEVTYFGINYTIERLYSQVCKEIVLADTATCLILHINGGQIEKIEDIVPAFKEIAYLGCDLWKRWKNEVGGRASQYLSADEDRQIGIGWIGLANMLAHFGVSYKEFIDAGEDSLEYGYTNKSVAHKLISAIYDGYQAAAEIGREAGLERMFTIAPTQSCAFRYKDLDGNTVCKQINPPLDRVVRRTSHTVDKLAGLYRYGNKVETMKSFITDNGVDAVQQLWELFQRLMNTTGMAHCMSFDLYREIDEEWLHDFMLRSPLVTTYYQLADKIDQSYLNKSRANTATSNDEKVACSIANPGSCASCEE